MRTVALFGHGNFGKVHAQVLRDLGAELYIIDKDCAPEPHLRVDPLTDPSVFDHISDATHWDIVTQHATHAPLLEEGLRRGKHVLVEKPATREPSELDRIIAAYPNAVAGVDYVEIGSPVVRKAVDLRNAGFTPLYTCHVRIKNIEPHLRGYRIVMDDCTHDISVADALGIAGNPTVHVQCLESWRDATPFPYETDARARFVFAEDHRRSTFFGSFAEGDVPDSRFFMLLGTYENRPALFYGNTLRGYLRAALMHTDRLLREARVVKVLDASHPHGHRYQPGITNENQDEVLARYGAEILYRGDDNDYHEGLKAMLANFLTAETPGALFCPLSRALHIERLAGRVYEAAGKPEMARSLY